MYTHRSWGRVIGLACLLAFLLIGPYRIMEFLYGIGLYPTFTEEEVVAALKRRPGIEGMTCQQNVAGWEYVCDYSYRNSSGTLSRHRDGIRTTWMTPIGSSTALRVDGPILSEAENAKWVEEQNRKFREPVNLRTATVAELRRIPLVDRYLAEQIHAAVRGGTVTGVDDLLRVKGIDQPRFSVIRPRVRWE
jgi:DNA uptake protein ComE-like DNA-binding protein